MRSAHEPGAGSFESVMRKLMTCGARPNEVPRRKGARGDLREGIDEDSAHAQRLWIAVDSTSAKLGGLPLGTPSRVSPDPETFVLVTREQPPPLVSRSLSKERCHDTPIIRTRFGPVGDEHHKRAIRGLSVAPTQRLPPVPSGTQS